MRRYVLRYSKTGDIKRATCFATLLQNELNNDVARFTTDEKKPSNLICCKTGSNVSGKTCDMARYSTHFAVMLQNKFHVFCNAQSTEAL